MLRTLLYFLPHVAFLIVGIAVVDVCQSAPGVSMSRILALTIFGVAVALLGYAIDPE